MKRGKKKKCLCGVLIAAIVVCIVEGSIYKIVSGRKAPAVSLTEAEAIEQSKEKEYSVVSGDVTYTFRTDGTLVLSGTGSTKEFKTLEESQTFFLRELYKEDTGSYPVSLEQTAVLHCVLDRVTKIIIEEGVTELGTGACSPFYYAENVVLPDSLQRVDRLVFLGTGQFAAQSLVYEGQDTEEIPEQEASSFVTRAEELNKLPETGKADDEEVALRPEEERGTVPGRELLTASVKLGDTVTGRLYENGVLVVSGYGATYEFSHSTEMENHVMEQLHCVSHREVEERWFDCVAEIIIEETVERIGDNALASYKNVRMVMAEEIKELGNRAFFYCGAETTEDTIWNISLDDVKWEEDSFSNCRNVLPLEE